MNHGLDFSTEYLPSVVSRRALDLAAPALPLGIFLEKVPELVLREPRLRRTRWPAHGPELAVLLLPSTDRVGSARV